MKKRVTVPVSFLFAAMLWLSGCSERVSTTPEPAAEEEVVAKPVELKNFGSAPKWTLTGLDGKKISLDDFAGKVVVIDFWATFCPPCVEEIPRYVELQKKYEDEGLVITGLSADRKGPMWVLDFVTKLGVNYPIALLDDETIDAYDVGPLPTAFVLDREGNVRYYKIGFTEDGVEQIEQVVRNLL